MPGARPGITHHNLSNAQSMMPKSVKRFSDDIMLQRISAH